jgi:hypothetical protein
MGQVIVALLRKTAIEQISLAVLSPLKPHPRHQAFHFILFCAGVCGLLGRKTARNLFVKNKFEVMIRFYAILALAAICERLVEW